MMSLQESWIPSDSQLIAWQVPDSKHIGVAQAYCYCLWLLYGLSDLSIKKLQKIQNSAARIVKKKSRRCQTSPLLKELHWLPISDRIKLKILLLTFRAQYLEQPVYISQLLSPYAPPRGLRSSGKALLSLPNPRLKSYGYRCFAYAAPYLWNQLPDHIRFCTDLSAFKRNLKTHFFTCSFECN